MTWAFQTLFHLLKVRDSGDYKWMRMFRVASFASKCPITHEHGHDANISDAPRNTLLAKPPNSVSQGRKTQLPKFGGTLRRAHQLTNGVIVMCGRIKSESSYLMR